MKTIQGNIFDGEWDGIVHCCNIYNTMGAGIAKEIKRLYPEAYKADDKTESGDTKKLGNFSHHTYFKVDQKDKTIFNLYAQKGVGNNGNPLNRNLQYDLLYDGMFKICEFVEKTQPYTLAMPMLGAGLAGGDWNIIEKILENVESHFANITFNTYKL